MGKTKQIKILTCSKCGVSYPMRTDKPLKCPRCQAFFKRDKPKIKTIVL